MSARLTARGTLCCVLLVALTFAAGCRAPDPDDAAPRRRDALLTQSTPKLAAATDADRPEADVSGLYCLRQAYPEQVCGSAANTLVLCNGRRLIYDDGRPKTAEERLDQPDLEDMFTQVYAPGPPELPPAEGFEPGRVRELAFFDAMYGAGERDVRKHLTSIPWLSGKALQVSTVNGVDRRLRAVSDALERLAEPLRTQVAEVAGTFNFRDIKGTSRKSAHSYGIAIDVAPSLADYWRWREDGADPPRKYRNRMPMQIVEAFEREGFIWGGRWNHYDTMHFEYRPELLVPECRRPVRGATVIAEAPARAQPGPAVSTGVPEDDRVYAWLGSGSGSTSHLEQRFAPPPGFTRSPLPADSFGAWLRRLPLRPEGSSVRLHDGSPKALQNVHAAVIDIDVGKRDLQQCADAVMRLRAEYLFGTGRCEQVCFRSVGGDAMPYEAYRRGLRPPPGRGGPWTPLAAADRSHAGFRGYLDRVFGIANTASLLRELEPVRDARQVEAGDVYIEAARAGRFGHAVLVLDVARDRAGERVFLIAQSYMPAQDMHVLVNLGERGLSPWYRATADGGLRTPEWDFPAGALRRFARTCASE
ncbi:MAG TPA: DUF4846 domain-containing protein [Polyangiales bacterium]|nr:DUF4846 domain-containing protein [Polyangiales bacterium]